MVILSTYLEHKSLIRLQKIDDCFGIMLTMGSAKTMERQIIFNRADEGFSTIVMAIMTRIIKIMTTLMMTYTMIMIMVTMLKMTFEKLKSCTI